MYINIVNTPNIKKIIRKRKKWISLDKNTNFRNMFETIKYLESLPIIKYTCKNNYNNSINSNNNNYKKLTKKYNYF
jgi:hypothetical protein